MKSTGNLATQPNDLALFALRIRMDEELVQAQRKIDALPEVMSVRDEMAAIEAATAPVEAIVDEILAAWPVTPAGYAIQRTASKWASGH